MPEWLMGVDCKSTGYAYVGSNPTRPIHKSILGWLQDPKFHCPRGSVVEHILGKDEVMSSILIAGLA